MSEYTVEVRIIVDAAEHVKRVMASFGGGWDETGEAYGSPFGEGSRAWDIVVTPEHTITLVESPTEHTGR